MGPPKHAIANIKEASVCSTPRSEAERQNGEGNMFAWAVVNHLAVFLSAGSTFKDLGALQ